MESLGRGVVALRRSNDSVFISWRMFGTDPDNVAFNIYRITGSRATITTQLNNQPITNTTTFIDTKANFNDKNSYYVRSVIKGLEVESSTAFSLPADAPVRPYLSLPLQTIAGYFPNDVSVGDLDGDGEYEIVLHQISSRAGFTDPPIFQAYKINGTLLWTIRPGKNVREGPFSTPIIVYDLDGDGKAEVAMKTADGGVDGKGKIIGGLNKGVLTKGGRSNSNEYFTIFNGQTGEALATTDYISARTNVAIAIGKQDGSINKSGNNANHFLACVAYLDGVHPSIVLARDYNGRSILGAMDWKGAKITSRWIFDSEDLSIASLRSTEHHLTVADVNGDGKDEVIYDGIVINNDGKALFATPLGDGGALHLGDLDPTRPGLEVFGMRDFEANAKGPGVALWDAKTGEVIWKASINHKSANVLAENIDPNNPGAEMWWNGSTGLYNMKGDKIGPYPSSSNFLIYWDGDFTRELLDGNHIDKYKTGRIFTAVGCSIKGSKSTPALVADIVGDWREEFIERSIDNKELRIFSSTMQTNHRMYTLMHNPQYRLNIATQNMGNKQPPHLSFYLGEDAAKPPKPNIVYPKPTTGSVR